MNRAVAVGLGLIIVVVLGAVFFRDVSEPPPAPPQPEPFADGRMSEEERLRYIADHVQLADVAIGPDTEPDSDQPVPGLLRVTGKILNQGDRWIDKAVLVVYPKDAQGEVLAVDQSDVIPKGRLKAGAVDEFSFQIRDREEFSGDFDFELQ
jgi:hypothetical protein